MTTCLSDAVARTLLGEACISFMNGELIEVGTGVSSCKEIILKTGINSKIAINNRAYHDDGSIWRVKNVFRRYYPDESVSKIIVLTKTKKVWRQ